MRCWSHGEAFAAVDLGSSSGRVLVGILGDEHADVQEVHRFPNTPVRRRGRLEWDVDTLFDETLIGLSAAADDVRNRGLTLAGIGVDSWGVDYGLLDSDGRLRPGVGHHRSSQITERALRDRGLTESATYRRTGIPDQAINTAFQLHTDMADGRARAGDTVLLVPDLWIWLLCGAIGADPTIASTTQLFDPAARTWANDIIDAYGLAQLRFPRLEPSGSRAGVTTPEVTARLGTDGPVAVYRVAGHDTACAFAFATASPEQEATGLVSSGSWSLAGLALAEPVREPAALDAGFSNELGIDGQVTFIRNLSGMWILQECLRIWADEDANPVDLQNVLAAAREVPSDPRIFDTSRGDLLAPEHMPSLVNQLAAEAGRPQPRTRPQTVRAVLDSLAAAYAASLATAADLAGLVLNGIRIVGGGSQNRLLVEMAAARTGLAVTCGPVEASAFGNIAIQAATAGAGPTAPAVYDHLVTHSVTGSPAAAPAVANCAVDPIQEQQS